MDEAPRDFRYSPWPHRLAVALALVTFPLIWVGGLVTTYDAGMAVPDWPGTYGYNLFLYPWQTWLAGPWDLFIEHGHRLLGATAGLVAIALYVTTYAVERRPAMHALAAGALLLVIFQGGLGGARVVFDARLVALVHGCVGPLFFAYLAGVIVATSRWWSDAKAPRLDTGAVRSLVTAAWFTVGLAFLQLALGAVVRHVPLTSSPTVFRAALLLHFVFAALLSVQITVSSWRMWSVCQSARGLTFPSLALPILLLVQLGLGVATYVAKYSWPAWLADYSFAAGHVVQEKSLLQSMTVTAHVGNGSLILFLAALLAVRVSRISVLSTKYSVLGARPLSAKPAVPSRFAAAAPTA
jgi:cytochrome c oxidase assembly protein subunit 15